ncbi:hypothetical protein GQ55_4G293800 [Panicum hallii var. hallii]|uniref:Uncharacterized protein n=1 Tax=Panicum hallii var. hallii TaxID=1504633 RepID=A0A2T7E1E8_9POAL|nr:hypothetical protein GQ55_4G293800 [Panicum hallii var. hallii]
MGEVECRGRVGRGGPPGLGYDGATRGRRCSTKLSGGLRAAVLRRARWRCRGSPDQARRHLQVLHASVVVDLASARLFRHGGRSPRPSLRSR